MACNGADSSFPLLTIELLNELAKNFNALSSHLPDIVDNLVRKLKDLEQRYNIVISEKQKLTIMQSANQIGENIDEALEKQLQLLSLQFTSLINELRYVIEFGRQLQAVMHQNNQAQWGPAITSSLQEIFSTMLRLWTNLVSISLVVTMQPGPVLQKGKPFDTEVRLFALANSLPIKVRCRIITVSDAEELQSGRKQCGQLSIQGTIGNNETGFAVKDGALVSIQHKEKNKQMILRDIGPRKKANNAEKNLVTELKCVVLYEIIPTQDLQNQLFGYPNTIWAVSLPIVLITHGKQLIDAYSTIIWDRAFGSKVEVGWSSLADVLNKAFAHLTASSKRRLTESDLEYLRRKLNNGNGSMYTYAHFAKDKIGPEGKFTFWTYFCCICDVIAKKLLHYWNKGYIMGFSNKDEASNKLCRLGKPAFLLRFSDSQLGCLAVTYIRNNTNGVKQILLPALQPEKAVSLIELLKGFSELHYVRYLCNKDFEPIDKGLFLDDKSLVVVDTPSEKTNGYHKIRLVIKLDDGDNDELPNDENEEASPPTLSTQPSFSSTSSNASPHSLSASSSQQWSPSASNSASNSSFNGSETFTSNPTEFGGVSQFQNARMTPTEQPGWGSANFFWIPNQQPQLSSMTQQQYDTTDLDKLFDGLDSIL